jgi:hypothetical protein
MSKLRRYEILLPLKFNNGQPIPWRLVGETIQELKHHFGGVSGESKSSTASATSSTPNFATTWSGYLWMWLSRRKTASFSKNTKTI